METILQNLGESIGIWGYFVLFFYSLGGGFVAILAAGILSSGVVESLSALNIFACIFVAGFANFIGSSGLFYLARYQKHDVMRFFRNHKRKIALAHIWIRRFDYFVIFLQKYLYGIKTLIPLVIGFSKYSARKFLLYNFVASMLWSAIIGGVSFVLGDVLKRAYERFDSPYIFPLFGLFIVLLIVFALNKTSKKIKAK